METYTEKGIYGEGTVYVLKSVEDFDEYEKLLKSREKVETDFLKWNPNFYAFKEEFIDFIGKIWEDKNQLRYTLNGTPFYEEYKVIAIEDNDPMADWYWKMQNTRKPEDIKYLLANSYDLKDGLKK